MNESVTKTAPENVVEAVINGLIDENRYYNCSLDADWNTDDGSLISSLADAEWEDPASECVDKNMKRAIKHLSEFHPECLVSPAVICCYVRVDVNRERIVTIEANSNRKEEDIKAESLDYQMTLKDYKDLLCACVKTGDRSKEYPARTIKVKTLKNSEIPACKCCSGSGKVNCYSCYGIGNGVCPDCDGTGGFFGCKEGGQGVFISKFGITRRLYYGEPCPTCKGQGSFECEVCGETGLLDCSFCGGTGKENGILNGQKIVRIKDHYAPYFSGELYLPDGDIMNFDVTMVKDELCKMQPIVFNQTPVKQPISKNVNDACKDQVKAAFDDIVGSESLVGLNYVVYKIPETCMVKFTYGDEDYDILVVGNYAFAKDLPAMSFIENIFGLYKKNIK